MMVVMVMVAVVVVVEGSDNDNDNDSDRVLTETTDSNADQHDVGGEETCGGPFWRLVF